MSGPKGQEPLVGRRLRANTRWPIEVPVTIVDDQRRTEGLIAFDTHDLSVAGAFLKATLLFEIDDELGLEFTLEEGRSVRARGRVVRVQRDAPSGMGIAFTQLDDADRDAIRRFLNKGS